MITTLVKVKKKKDRQVKRQLAMLKPIQPSFQQVNEEISF